MKDSSVETFHVTGYTGSATASRTAVPVLQRTLDTAGVVLGGLLSLTAKLRDKS